MQDNLVGDAVDGQPADDPERLLVQRRDGGRLEAELRVLPGVEEVRRAQTLVALWLIGVERLDVDRPVDLRGRQILW